MKYTLVLMAAIAITVVGDYLLKHATEDPRGIQTPAFFIGVALYATTGLVWYQLMKMMSLAAVAVIYSSATMIVLALMGALFFRESIGLRESIGIALAVTSILVMQS